jgi:hypothetical protein
MTHRRKRTEKVCGNCGTTFVVRTCRTGNYCSQECTLKAMAKKNTGSMRTSKWVACAYCGKTVKRYKSRTSMYERAFCNAECYHNWDSWHKQQPEQSRILAERRLLIQYAPVSKVEDRVAAWLDAQGVTYERQASLSRYSVDFKVGSAYIEVQGCYWHGCPHCFTLLTPQQQKVATRDKAKATYCRRRGILLYTIWEHDVTHGNFAALMPLVAA